MAALESLKRALRQKVNAATSSPTQPLSDAQYSAGFEILVRDSKSITYQKFIIPEPAEQLTPLFNSRIDISALEIGPGPESVLGYLPKCLRRKITKYTAFEPNALFAARLEEWLCSTGETESPLPWMQSPPAIHRSPFVVQDDTENGISPSAGDIGQEYDIVLFCHSMYGMNPKNRVIERALKRLVERPQGGMVLVFHRDGALRLDDLVCHRTASFPTGIVRVADTDEVLDCFAPFVAGFTMQNVDVNRAISVEWRRECRALGRREKAHPGHLLFSSPNIMVAFNQHAATLPELTTQVPLVNGERTTKNRQAQLQHPTSIIRPTEIHHIQRCVRWALRHGVGLTIIGGGHSGHCLCSNVVSVDMSAFNQVHILTAGEDGGQSGSDSSLGSGPWVIAGAGCRTGDIIRKTMAAGLTVPHGAHPSVGGGLWLQGGIGHLARLHGLACDAIVGAVVVSVKSSQILCVGYVPSQHWPAGAVRPENESDLLWAMKGAGTNFGIVVNVIFRSYTAPTYSIRKWVIPLGDSLKAQLKLSDFDKLVARKLPRNFSADAYLYADAGQLHLGVAMFESSMTRPTSATATHVPVDAILGPENSFEVVDGLGLFETEMYVSGIHGGHGGGKTSSFKRCLFFKCIREANVADRLVAAVETRPSPLCYLHLLQGGGAVGDVAADATAFGCRDWEFACVITGVWPREHNGTEVEETAMRWVYSVAENLLPFSVGVYCADLGPDPRDAAFAAKAFGPNRPRLARLKHTLDPHNVLAYASPLPKTPPEHKLEQVRQRPWLPEEHFLNVVYGAVDVSVLVITGLRDEAPVAALSHLVPDSKVLEIRVQAPEQTRRIRQGYDGGDGDADDNKDSNHGGSDRTPLDHRPSLVFDNDTTGSDAAEEFAERYLLPLFHEDLQRLSNMVRSVPDFPRPGVEFRHLLGISEQPGGLALCTRLLQNHFTGDWAKVHAVVTCEAGGFVYASALALRVDVPKLVLIREAGKLPPPTVSVLKPSSYISSPAPKDSEEKRIEIGRDVIPRGASVVVVDDVLSTGETLCAVLHLLDEAGVALEDVSVMALAEFPVHRGRELLLQRGFGRVKIQSLLVFGGE
ncbi:MAG: hypothetical protein Q9160_006652 [Pyrenula sp. 1 TL-2023]